MFEDENQITIEEVDRVLSEIENKYSPNQSESFNEDFEENLVVLSKELDTVGAPSVDLTKPPSKVFNQVVSSARSLVQIHRKTLLQMKDVNISVQTKNSNSHYLHTVIDDCKSQIYAYEGKSQLLQNRISVLENKITEYKKRDTELKNEMEKVKRYSNSKNNELTRHIKKLSDENKHLKECLGHDFNTTHTHSKDDLLLKIIGKYKHREEVYKDTIKKLQENNQQLLEEIMDSRTDVNTNKA